MKYAGACEIACGSEIRLRRVEGRISFHVLLNKVKQDISQFPKEIISHSPSGEYFTSSSLTPRRLCAILDPKRWCYYIQKTFRFDDGFVSFVCDGEEYRLSARNVHEIDGMYEGFVVYAPKSQVVVDYAITKRK